MLLKKQLELEALLFILLGGVVGSMMIIYQESNHGTGSNPVILNTRAAEATPTVALLPTAGPTAIPTTLTKFLPSATPVPSSAPAFVPKAASMSQISSDGTKKVTLKTVEHKDNTVTYDIATADDSTVIFSKTLPPGDTISIPFNTWSADNRYFFLQENTPTGKNIMVFQASGEIFADGEAYLDLTGDFNKQGSPYTFDQATGWAEGHLIVINTKASDGTQGSSYWFEVPSQAVIPLATKF